MPTPFSFAKLTKRSRRLGEGMDRAEQAAVMKSQPASPRRALQKVMLMMRMDEYLLEFLAERRDATRFTGAYRPGPQTHILQREANRPGISCSSAQWPRPRWPRAQMTGRPCASFSRTVCSQAYSTSLGWRNTSKGRFCGQRNTLTPSPS